MPEDDCDCGRSGIGSARAAGDALFRSVYDDLRRVAAIYLDRETPAHTLQPTALVHEAYLRLGTGAARGAKDTVHFRAVAARAMRLVLIDHARKRGARKRGGELGRITLSAQLTPDTPAHPINLLELEEGLQHLESRDQRLTRIVELRFFGGLTVEEVASELEISATVVKEDWRLARAILTRFIGPET